jgi:hypothetical protein
LIKGKEGKIGSITISEMKVKIIGEHLVGRAGNYRSDNLRVRKVNLVVVTIY